MQASNPGYFLRSVTGNASIAHMQASNPGYAFHAMVGICNASIAHMQASNPVYAFPPSFMLRSVSVTARDMPVLRIIMQAFNPGYVVCL